MTYRAALVVLYAAMISYGAYIIYLAVDKPYTEDCQLVCVKRRPPNASK